MSFKKNWSNSYGSMKKLKSTIIDKNVKTIELYLYMHKFSYFHSQVVIYEKSCSLQLVLCNYKVSFVTNSTKDTISQNIVPLLKFKYSLSKWGKEWGECDMWKGRFKVICGVVKFKKNILLYFWLPTWSLNHVQNFGIFLQNYVNFKTWNLTNFSSNKHWIHSEKFPKLQQRKKLQN
jgi:hypothetical protein